MLLTCLYIFFARIIDVSLGTMRTIFFVKGKIIQPFVLAFFEVLVWYAVARQALNSEGNAYLIAVFYALGYATGTLIGSKLSSVLIKGYVGIQVVVNKSGILVNKLRKLGYAVSVISLKNSYDGKKDMIYIEAYNKKIKEITNIIKKYDEKAFIVINETKLVQNGLLK